MTKVMKHKAIGVFTLLLSLVGNYCVAQEQKHADNIEIKNDAGENLYIALVKNGPSWSSNLYEGKDNARIVGSDGLLKAGASVKIKNFPKPQPNDDYSLALWVATTSNNLNDAIKAKAANWDTIIAEVFLGYSPWSPVIKLLPVANGTLKVRIFKTGHPHSPVSPIAAYGYEFVSK